MSNEDVKRDLWRQIIREAKKVTKLGGGHYRFTTYENYIKEKQPDGSFKTKYTNDSKFRHYVGDNRRTK